MLSDHEKQLLAEIEAGLHAQDAHFTRRMSGNGHGRKAALGVLAALAGMALVIAGVAVPLTALGVLGFCVLLTGSTLAWQGFTSTGAEEEHAPSNRGRKQTLTEKAEERWRARQERDGNTP